jgi:uncharacterized protein (TIGR03118 family)
MTSRGRWLLATATVAGCALAFTAPAMAKSHHRSHSTRVAETDLVSDIPGRAALTDPNLVNPWGLSSSPTSPLWVADNGSMMSTLYTGKAPTNPFSILGLVVNVIGPATGTVFNPGGGFVVSDGHGHSGSSTFLFDTEDGQIVGWSPAVPPPAPSTQGQIAMTTPGGVYKGLTLADDAGAPRLYASNFAAGTVDVFDDSFSPVMVPGAFKDKKIPKGYAPFGIQVLGGKIYVTYAKQDSMKHDEVDGPGRGFVDVYSTHGKLLKRLIRRTGLNAPWGLALAPAGWGRLSGDLLVGNFGDGRIHAYNIHSGRMVSTLKDTHGHVLSIDGLWGLRPGNGTAGDTNAVMFSAGLDGEAHGLLGALTVAHSHHT